MKNLHVKSRQPHPRLPSYKHTGLVSAGVLLIDGVALPVDYQYDITTDNNSGRTLAFFSTLADGEMRPGHDFSNPFFRDFQLFFDYYGTFDYADQIITAALEGVDTNLVNGNVNVMTATVGLVAREGTLCVRS